MMENISAIWFLACCMLASADASASPDEMLNKWVPSADESIRFVLDNLVDNLFDQAPLSNGYAKLDNLTFGKPGLTLLGNSLRSFFPMTRKMQGFAVDGRTWANSLALEPCARQLSSLGSRTHTQVTAVAESTAEKTSIQTQIEEIIALQPVVIFSKTTCPFCQSAKANLGKALGGQAPPVVELDTLDPSMGNAIQDHLQTLTGARTVPRVFVGHKFIGGGTDVANMAESGELKRLVDMAMHDHKEDLRGKDIATMGKSEEDWQKELSPQLYRILRQRGTEPPGSHEYDQFYPTAGYFSCAGCGLPLYSAASKFRSNCGWPVFDKCYHSDEIGCHVCTRPDGSGALEILCPKCSGHLGHVFFDSFTEANPNGERH